MPLFLLSSYARSLVAHSVTRYTLCRLPLFPCAASDQIVYAEQIVRRHTELSAQFRDLFDVRLVSLFSQQLTVWKSTCNMAASCCWVRFCSLRSSRILLPYITSILIKPKNFCCYSSFARIYPICRNLSERTRGATRGERGVSETRKRRGRRVGAKKSI